MKILGFDDTGTIALYTSDDGDFTFTYYLTPCCGADATGVSVTADNPDGVACRACYRPVDPALAGPPSIQLREAAQ